MILFPQDDLISTGRNLLGGIGKKMSKGNKRGGKGEEKRGIRVGL